MPIPAPTGHPRSRSRSRLLLLKALQGLAITIAIWVFSTARVFAQETPVPAASTSWVTDEANLLSPAVRQSVDARLAAYQRQTGHQVVVWIGSTLDQTPLEDFVVKVFKAWKVGREGADDGVLIAVLAKDRRIAIEVGYGLEAQVPDIVASRIINEQMVPRLRAGDADGAIVTGVDALLERIEGHPFVAKPGMSSGGAERLSIGQIILFALLAAGFIVLLITNPRLALMLLFVMAGRGGARRGGGFGGGGGRSGGGGARGSW